MSVKRVHKKTNTHIGAPLNADMSVGDRKPHIDTSSVSAFSGIAIEIELANSLCVSR